MKKKLDYLKYVELEDKYKVLVDKIASIRLIVFILMIVSFILSYYYFGFILRLISIISMLVFIILILIHDKYYKLYDYYYKYISIVNEYIDRENGKWRNFDDIGEDFLEDNKSFLEDLDVFGKDSLFQYLNACKTIGGRRKLAKRLSNNKFSENSLKVEQDAVVEIADNVSFDVNFQVSLMNYKDSKVDFWDGISFLHSTVSSKVIDVVLAVIFSLISLILLFGGIFGIITIRYFYGMFVFNYLISFMYSYIFNKDFEVMEKTINNYGGLRDVFLVVIGYKFKSVKLKKFVNDMNDSMVDVKKLKILGDMNSVKSNYLTNVIFNGLFCFNIILMYGFSKFVNGSLDSLEKAIDDIEELEALVSVASIGVVRKDKCIPEYSDNVLIDVCNIKHPLLDEKICVGNDFTTKNGINIITGSNMGGKTSFLRTIGINMVLMSAGGYVCADSFVSNYYKIFTSMRIKDDTLNGVSTFYGELKRIKDAIDYIGKGNMLVLIDEIFKGTNYQDRMYGAREVIKRLKNKNIITFITTHDFELCDEVGVNNYHVREYYEGKLINFDYKIREGKCSSTNARYLMKEIGIID